MSSVDKALKVLLLLGSESEPLGVREIGRRLDMSPPTVHRLLTTLAAYGFAQQIDGRREYRLGWACLDLGRAVLAGTDIYRVGPPVALRLRDATTETVTIQVPAGHDQVCIFEAEGLHEVTRRVGVGRRMPLHAGASGRAILAFLSEAEIEAHLQSGLPRVGPNTVTDRAVLRRLLDDTRRTGLTRSHQESASGIAAVSVPVFHADGRVAGSLSVSGPEARLSDEVLDGINPVIIDSGIALSRELGYRAQHPAWSRVA